MSNCHSLDLRERVINYVLAGNQITAASQLFRVGRKTIYNWLALLKKTGDLKPKQPIRNDGYKIDHKIVSEYFKKTPDATLQEVANSFSTHVSAIWYICKKQKITRKKRLHTTKSVTNRKDKNL
jgi:putative transposase